jgi:hypothetical protein
MKPVSAHHVPAAEAVAAAVMVAAVADTAAGRDVGGVLRRRRS